MRKLAFLPLIITLAACSSGVKKPATQYTHQLTPLPSDSNFCLRLPAAGSVAFHGELNLDNSGIGNGAFLYPAPNAAGLLAAVLTHAAISGSVKNSQESNLQTKADDILSSLRPAIDTFQNSELAKLSNEQFNQNQNRQALQLYDPKILFSGYVIESAPLFIISQDKTGIVLQNIIAVYPADHPDVRIYKNMVIVVSNQLAPKDSELFWIDKNGANLRDESARLLTLSSEIILDEILTNQNLEAIKYETFRYKVGSSEKFERGQLISEHQGRKLIRNLHGWLMSIPSSAQTVAAENHSFSDPRVPEQQ